MNKEEATQFLKDIMGKEGEKISIEVEIRDLDEALKLLGKMNNNELLYGCKVLSFAPERMYKRSFDNIQNIRYNIEGLLERLDSIENEMNLLIPKLCTQV